jgi:hypothetical protein
MFSSEDYGAVLLGKLGAKVQPGAVADPFASKVGGAPAWLAAPAQAPQCGRCGGAMRLAMQVYAPVEYQRSLVILSCGDAHCCETSEGWCVVRQQAEDVPAWSAEPAVGAVDDDAEVVVRAAEGSADEPGGAEVKVGDAAVSGGAGSGVAAADAAGAAAAYAVAAAAAASADAADATAAAPSKAAAAPSKAAAVAASSWGGPSPPGAAADDWGAAAADDDWGGGGGTGGRPLRAGAVALAVAEAVATLHRS